MKKKLFVFVVLSMVVLFSACKPAVKGGDTSNSETPLELTAANLAGKWVLDSDSTKWYEFKEDGTYSAYIGTSSTNYTYHFEITDNKALLYDIRISDNRKVTGDTLKIELLYRNRCLINSKKYNRQ